MRNLFLEFWKYVLISNLLLCNRSLSVLGRHCPSFCTKDKEACQNRGGKIIGYCTNSMACCDLTLKWTGSCGTRKGNESTTVYFQSPNYPAYSSNDLLCTFSYELRTDVVGIILDFEVFETDDVKFGPTAFSCDTDYMFLMGFHSWTPPPICGNLHGYKMVIDDAVLSEKTKEMSLHAVMSSTKYRWRIKITQITEKQCDDETPANSNKNNATNNSGSGYTRDAYGKVGRSKLNLIENSGNNDDFDQQSVINPLVVNGDDATAGKVPWQASLRVDFKKMETIFRMKGNVTAMNGPTCDASEGFHRCGGSIISDQEILTAAHCFTQTSKKSHVRALRVLKVVVGDINKCTDGTGNHGDGEFSKNPSVQEFEIQSVVLHYGYDRDVIINDVAIIRLKTKIKFNQNVQPVRLADEDEDFTEQPAFLSGWGRTNLQDQKNRGSDILQYTNNLQIMNPKECKSHTQKYYQAAEETIASYGKYKDVFRTTICIKPLNVTRDVLAGEGDSGGPLVVFPANKTGTSSEPVLVGIVSYGAPVARKVVQGKSAGNFVDYFQSVSYYRNWIDTTLCALNN